MTRVLDFIRKLFKCKPRRYDWVADTCADLYRKQGDAFARIAALEAKVDELSRPLPNVHPVPDNLPRQDFYNTPRPKMVFERYGGLTIGRFPSDVQAEKDGDGG